jgi:protein-S-isoprenylcysteine O-methyltransferase Ste14
MRGKAVLLNGLYKTANEQYYIRRKRRCSSTVEHGFRKAGVEGSNPSIGFIVFDCFRGIDMKTFMRIGLKRISPVVANSRIFASRIFSIMILVIAIFTSHSFSQESLADIVFETSGLFLLTICSMGRLWALMYISGSKSSQLITDGPYSIVRNPLYFFSFIGAIGIGLASENLLILVLIIIFYAIYYPLTIIAEEKKLEDTFGQPYLEYKQRTPKFLPKLSLYKGPALYTVKANTFVRNFVSGMWFIWIFILLHTIEMAQNIGYLPVYWRIP